MKKAFIATTSFATYSSKPLELLKKYNVQFELNSLKRTLTEDEASRFLAHQDGVISGTEPLTERVLDQCKNLKVISRVGVGVENVDVEAARRKNIAVFNTPFGPTEAVAELALGLILNLLRHIGTSDRNIRNRIWQKEMGSLLNGKTIGIIGFGRIGRKLANLVKAFNCKVVIYDPFVSSLEDSQIKKVSSLESLLGAVDIVSLHLPYSKEYHHMINTEKLALMRQGAILVNVARGGLVDEQALYDCLKSRRISGAALDTFEQEPYSGMLSQLDNIILTPHIGSYALESRIQMEIDAVINLLQGFGISVEN